MISSKLAKCIKSIENRLQYLKYKDSLPNNPVHDDIYIVEFPKSGITWLQHILGNIEIQLNGVHNERVTFYNHHKYLPDVHQLRGADIHRTLKRTFIKSHSEHNPYYYFVIYLIRNPFDVMVSYYNFMLAHGYDRDFFTFVKEKKYGVSAWKRHVNSWHYRRVDAQRIHFLRYEDLIRNAFVELKNIYKNLGVGIDDKILSKSIEMSSIKEMQELEGLYRKYNPNYDLNFVGKDNKIDSKLLMKNEIKDYILKMCHSEIDFFYGSDFDL